MAKKKSWDFYLFFDTHGSMYFLVRICQIVTETVNLDGLKKLRKKERKFPIGVYYFIQYTNMLYNTIFFAYY